MKKLIFYFSLVLFPFFCLSQNINPFVEREGDEEFKIRRDKWLRSFHRCEEGLPYWIINLEQKNMFFEKTRLKGTEEQMLSRWYAEGRIFGEWKERGSNNQSGRVHTVDYDTLEKVIYLASAGGNIWKGSINGNDWVCLNDGKRFPNIRMVRIVKFSGKKRILVVANSPSCVYYTDNDGRSWVKAKGLDNPEKWGWTIRGTVTLNNSIYVLLCEWNFKTWKMMISIYKSNDFGETFSPIYSSYNDPELADIWAPRYGVNNLFFITKDTLFSIDNENQIKIISINQFIDKYTSGILMTGTTATLPISIYLAVKTTSVKTEFYYSTNGGLTFNKTGKFNFYPFEKNSFEASVVNPKRVYFGQVEFYVSNDMGLSWDTANKWTEYYSQIETKLHADIPGIVSFKVWDEKNKIEREILFICTDGGLYVSYDGGKTYTNLSLSRLNISQYYSIYTYRANPKVLFAGSQDQGFQRCLHDSGAVLSFQQTISGDYGHFVSSNGGQHLWSVYPGFAMLYLNPNNENFRSCFWEFKGGVSLWMPPLVADPIDPNLVYLLSGKNDAPKSTPASYIYKLRFDERKFSINYEVLPFNFALDKATQDITALAISPFNPNLWYAATNEGKFLFSTNKGQDWTLVDGVAGPKSHYFYGNKILPSRNQLGKLVVAGSGYSNPAVLISYDNGKTFEPLGKNLPNTLFYDIEFNEDESLLFAATEIGPFVFHFAENRWFFLGGIGVPDQVFWDVEYLQALKIVRFATYGRGIWDFKIDRVLTIADKDESRPLVEVSPNPFSEKLKINLYGDIDKINLKIYDIEGRLVRNLFSGHIDGNLEIYWDGKSDEAENLPSGIYFIIFNDGQQVSYSKVIYSR